MLVSSGGGCRIQVARVLSLLISPIISHPIVGYEIDQPFYVFDRSKACLRLGLGGMIHYRGVTLFSLSHYRYDMNSVNNRLY